MVGWNFRRFTVLLTKGFIPNPFTRLEVHRRDTPWPRTSTSLDTSYSYGDRRLPPHPCREPPSWWLGPPVLGTVWTRDTPCRGLCSLGTSFTLRREELGDGLCRGPGTSIPPPSLSTSVIASVGISPSPSFLTQVPSGKFLHVLFWSSVEVSTSHPFRGTPLSLFPTKESEVCVLATVSVKCYQKRYLYLIIVTTLISKPN